MVKVGRSKQHFLMISCKSENNFIVKTTASLMPSCPFGSNSGCRNKRL